MSRMNTSVLWDVFKKNGTDKRAKCRLCGDMYSYKTSTGNLKVHLEKKHVAAYLSVVAAQQQHTELSAEGATATAAATTKAETSTMSPEKELVEEYLDSSETNAADSDHVSNNSDDDPLERSKKSYENIKPKNREKWFVQFNSNPETKPTGRKFTGGVKKVGKKKSEVLRQLDIMAQDREKTTTIQLEVYNLQKEKEKLIMEQNTKEHELRYNILQLEYDCKKEQLEMLRKENGK